MVQQATRQEDWALMFHSICCRSVHRLGPANSRTLSAVGAGAATAVAAAAEEAAVVAEAKIANHLDHVAVGEVVRAATYLMALQ